MRAGSVPHKYALVRIGHYHRRMITFSLPVPAPAALALCARVAALCEAAGDAILDIYQGEVVAQWKGDGTPLTAADQASHELLVAGLPLLPGNYHVVSEESSEVDQAAVDRGLEAPPYWLVDPLDGTKEFLSRNGEFTVNVALIWRGQPVLGVVHVPATGDTYVGARGTGPRRSARSRGRAHGGGFTFAWRRRGTCGVPRWAPCSGVV